MSSPCSVLPRPTVRGLPALPFHPDSSWSREKEEGRLQDLTPPVKPCPPGGRHEGLPAPPAPPGGSSCRKVAARPRVGWVSSSSLLVTGQLPGDSSHQQPDLWTYSVIHQLCLKAVGHLGHQREAVKTFNSADTSSLGLLEIPVSAKVRAGFLRGPPQRLCLQIPPAALPAGKVGGERGTAGETALGRPGGDPSWRMRTCRRFGFVKMGYWPGLTVRKLPHRLAQPPCMSPGVDGAGGRIVQSATEWVPGEMRAGCGTVYGTPR